jgi:hypothetical protein
MTPTDPPLEYCGICGEPTGRAGHADDSLYCEHCEAGPFCPECFEAHACAARKNMEPSKPPASR